MEEKAFLFASEVHKNQLRKNNKPYITHPIMVASILKKYGASENLICAGYLHDTIEDASVMYNELKEKFNQEIADLVLLDSEDKRLSWQERKNKVILDVTNGTRDFQMLVCADKLANLIDLKEDINENQEKAWDKFHEDKEHQKWFYYTLLDSFNKINDSTMYEEYKNTLTLIFEGE